MGATEWIGAAFVLGAVVAFILEGRRRWRRDRLIEHLERKVAQIEGRR